MNESLHMQTDQRRRQGIIFDLLLICVLLVGAYFRLVGLNWGEYKNLHPDERFLAWVGTDIRPIGADPEGLGPPPSVETIPWRAAYPEAFTDCTEWGGYFDASCSPLNPNNRGHGFYVYGTLPLFVTRYLVEWVWGHSGFNEMTDIGRALSTLVDLLVVFLVYLIAARLYDRRVGLLAAAFSAMAVLQIQLAHYFTVDTFLNFFTYLAIYFAVRVIGETWGRGEAFKVSSLFRQPHFWLSLAFGLALGSAVASKLNAAPVAATLPAAFGLALLRLPPGERLQRGKQALLYLALAAVASL